MYSVLYKLNSSKILQFSDSLKERECFHHSHFLENGHDSTLCFAVVLATKPTCLPVYLPWVRLVLQPNNMCLSVAGVIDPFQAIAEDIPERAAHLTWLDDEAQSVGLMLQSFFFSTLSHLIQQPYLLVLWFRNIWLLAYSCWRTSSTTMFYCSVVDAFCQSGVPWPNPPLPCWMWPTTWWLRRAAWSSSTAVAGVNL